MGKGKKRPWIVAKIEKASEETGGGGDAAVLAEAELRKKRKATDRTARERVFKEQNPTRFVAGEDETGEGEGAGTEQGGGGGGADWAGGGSFHHGGGGDGDGPGGYAKPPRGDRPPPPPWKDDERTDVTTAVPYTHLTLPTNREVSNPVVAVSV